MTTYQKHWNAEIETLLKELNAPQSLEKISLIRLKMQGVLVFFLIKLLTHFALVYLLKKEIKIWPL